ncbi:hypothetical protein [Cellulomonas endometrii]|uniref:hypothetical protein n=1 Tax=Cellulomonas endometrii TaxID=3036301 RepID=UPI0024ADE894|nr:hypothetical protein [Cellulomonas endometrii]
MTERVHLLRALARAVADQGAGPVAARMCRAAVELLDGDGGALTCSPTEPTRFTACATDELAARLDAAEEVVGDGPGLRAFREQRSARCSGAGPRPAAAAGAGEASRTSRSSRSWPAR